jgi:hypothetical protein
MSFRPSPLALALTAAYGALVAAPTHALTTSTSEIFAGGETVTDFCGAKLSTDCKVAVTSLAVPVELATPGLTRFDAATGVLMGTTIVLESTRLQTISGAFTSGTLGLGATTAGKGSSDAKLTAPGVSEGYSVISISGTGTVSTTNPTGGFAGKDSKVTNSTTVVGAGDLNSYVGAGTVATKLSSDSKFEVGSEWDNGKTSTTATSSATYSMGWSGKLTAQYDYLEHARASFASPTADLALDLDFGTLFLNEAAADIPFSIFNLAGDRVGLDLDLFAISGDLSKLTTNLAVFTTLAPGDDLDFLASFDTSSPGSFAVTYSLCFSDEDVGAAASRYDCLSDPDHFLLTINLEGDVIRRDTIPEPATLGLLGLGLAGLAWRRRRR